MRYLTILCLLLAACGREQTIRSSVGFLSSDNATMQIIVSELEQREVPFSVGIDGMITLDAQFEELLDEIKAIATNQTSSNRAKLTSDIRVRDHLVSLLERDNIPYSTEEIEAGYVVIWYSAEESTLKDYSTELSEYEMEVGN